MNDNHLNYSFFCIGPYCYFSAIMHMRILLAFLLGIVLNNYSQSNYPRDYFIHPLEIPLVLSGTFGELRTNHFHAGLDIKTQQVEGFNVLASANGYVSRINVSLWGYGNAIYITHPNGYTTVYGHLKQFSPKIDAYVRQKQYEQESYTIRLYPEPGDLQVEKGEVIALSGNSGSSGGPHLHFEIRDVKSDILNPMLFGMDIPDHKNPTIQSAFTYSRNDSSHVNQSSKNVELVLSRQYNGDMLANTIYAYGEIGFGINAYDRLDGALNQNGLYDLQMSVNGDQVFQFTADKFSFSESRFINSYIDYDRLIQLKQRVQKCFVEHELNNLSLYKNVVEKGYLKIKDSTDYEVTITASDFEGNKTRLIIPIRGKKDSILLREDIVKTPYFFNHREVNTIKDSVISVYFPKNIFYEDFYFDYGYENGVVRLHNSSVPVHDYFRLSFDVSKFSSEEVSKMYIAQKNRYGKLSYVSTKHKDNTLFTSSKSLGEFTLLTDNKPPTISPVGFKEDQWLTKYSTLKVRIHDKGSGIKSFRGEIDGKWVRMAFDPKKGIMTYDFSDRELDGTSHELKVTVSDNVNNVTTTSIRFNKKN